MGFGFRKVLADLMVLEPLSYARVCHHPRHLNKQIMRSPQLCIFHVRTKTSHPFARGDDFADFTGKLSITVYPYDTLCPTKRQEGSRNLLGVLHVSYLPVCSFSVSRGSEGSIVHTLTNPEVVSFEAAVSYLWLAGNEGMAKKMETTIVSYMLYRNY